VKAGKGGKLRDGTLDVRKERDANGDKNETINGQEGYKGKGLHEKRRERS